MHLNNWSVFSRQDGLDHPNLPRSLEAFKQDDDTITYHARKDDCGYSLLTKVHIVEAMIFPIVMYRCERWTIKKAERSRIDTFKLWC